MLFGKLAMAKEISQVCGHKPNCVSSFEEREDYKISALKNVDGEWSDIKAKVVNILGSYTNSEVINEETGFIHFVVTSRILRFKDDVYFWWDSNARVLNMKSESRVGHWDVGANRKRLNQFIKIWNHP